VPFHGGRHEVRDVGVRHRRVDIHRLGQVAQAGAEDDAEARLHARSLPNRIRGAVYFFEQSVQGGGFREK
jgi:hypothetical protein